MHKKHSSLLRRLKRRTGRTGNSGSWSFRLKPIIVLALILPLLLFALQPKPTYAVADCSVDYAVVNQWDTGFQANITITNNTGTAVQGWNLTWTFGPGQSFNSGWNATFNPSGSSMSASNVAGHWNGTIQANGGTAAFGIIGNQNGTVTIPDDFAVNGVSCIDDGSPTETPPPATATATSAPPTATNVPPTATNVPPTATNLPPTATNVPPTATTAPPTATPGGGGTCAVNYNIVNQWGNGFQADVTITNFGSTPISGWTLAWTFAGNEFFGSGWNADFTSSGQSVTASNPAGHWNGTIGANGGTAAFGIIVNHNGNLSIPTDFAVNGVSCIDDGSPTSTAVPPTNTSAPPTKHVSPRGAHAWLRCGTRARPRSSGGRAPRASCFSIPSPFLMP